MQIGNNENLGPKRISLLPRSESTQLVLFLIICSQRRYTSYSPVIIWMDRGGWPTPRGGLSSIGVYSEISPNLPRVSEQLSAMEVSQVVLWMVHKTSA